MHDAPYHTTAYGDEPYGEVHNEFVHKVLNIYEPPSDLERAARSGLRS